MGPGKDDPPQPDYVRRVPSYGTLLYAPLSPGFPAALRRQIRDFKPDLLHLHLPNTSAFWVLAMGCARQVRWVIHWHSDVVPSNIDGRMSIAYRFYRPFEQAVLNRAASVAATSDRYLASSEPLIRWRHKCVVIPLGLDPDAIRATLGGGCPVGRRLVGVRKASGALGRETHLLQGARDPHPGGCFFSITPGFL